MSLASVLLLGRSSWFGGRVRHKDPPTGPKPPPPQGQKPVVLALHDFYFRTKFDVPTSDYEPDASIFNDPSHERYVAPELRKDSNGMPLFSWKDLHPEPRFTCAHCQSYRESHLGSCEGCGSREVEES